MLAYLLIIVIISMHIHIPKRTCHNPQDGNTYYLASLRRKSEPVLWVCPTSSDGTPELTSAIPETDFVDPLDPAKREKVVTLLSTSRPTPEVNVVAKLIWKDEGRDTEGRSIGKAYAEDASGKMVQNLGWVTWKYAQDTADALQVEFDEV